VGLGGDGEANKTFEGLVVGSGVVKLVDRTLGATATSAKPGGQEYFGSGMARARKLGFVFELIYVLSMIFEFAV
jgi:hypothetical protein